MINDYILILKSGGMSCLQMDIQKYLNRINYCGNLETNIRNLFELHKCHMLSVPFENLDIYLKHKIILDTEKIYEKIVNRKRGGFCYELNGLFFALLSELGYDCDMISARVADKDGNFGREFDHMAIVVRAGTTFLADVGFGDSFIEPLILEPDLEQKQNRIIYKIIKYGDDYFKLAKSEDGKLFNDEYIFSLIPRALNDFAGMCEYHQSSPDSHFTQNRICSLPVSNGRISLSGMKIITSHGGERSERNLRTQEEYTFALKKFFDIEL